MGKASFFEEYMQYAHDKGWFSGTWLLKKDGVVVSNGALGSASPDKRVEMNTDTLFDIASVSKQFTATAVMLLRDRGQLSINDPLERFFPNMVYPGIKISNLLNHTSGLPDYSNWLSEYAKNTGLHPNNSLIEEMISFHKLPRQFEPGKYYCYCNMGYCVLAKIVEHVSGKKFADFLKKEIFEPAGMKQTQIYHRFVTGKALDNMAEGSVWENGRYYGIADSECERYTIALDGIEGDGGVVTSVNDLLLWDEALRNRTVLNEISQKEMVADHVLPDGMSTGYGYGWCLHGDPVPGGMISHTGRWAGYSSFYGRMIGEDSMLAVLCNRYGGDIMAWCEMLDAFPLLLRGQEASRPRTLESITDHSISSDIFPSYCGKFRLTQEPIRALFGKTIEIYECDGGIASRLSFMDTVFNNTLVPVSPGRFVESKGLFYFRFSEDELTTEMYGKTFVFTREKTR